MKIKNNTKKGYLVAEKGDGIDISSRMKNHRGTVQKGISQTITTQINVGVLADVERSERERERVVANAYENSHLKNVLPLWVLPKTVMKELEIYRFHNKRSTTLLEIALWFPFSVVCLGKCLI